MNKPRIHFTIPYSFDKKLFEAYDQEFEKISNPDDWVALTDGDIMFFPSDFGHIIQEHIIQHPGTGLFTCYTNRIKNDYQLYSKKAWNIDSIKYHFKIDKTLRLEKKGISRVVKAKLGGMLMVIKKAVWDEIRDELMDKCKDYKLVVVDNAISDVLMAKGYELRIMEDLYVLHYRRFAETNKERGIE